MGRELKKNNNNNINDKQAKINKHGKNKNNVIKIIQDY